MNKDTQQIIAPIVSAEKIILKAAEAMEPSLRKHEMAIGPTETITKNASVMLREIDHQISVATAMGTLQEIQEWLANAWLDFIEGIDPSKIQSKKPLLLEIKLAQGLSSVSEEPPICWNNFEMGTNSSTISEEYQQD